jgi:hypothetical protein
MTLDEAAANIGRNVVYRPLGEEGVITSVNNSYVFVRYRGDLVASKATCADDLFLSDGA